MAMISKYKNDNSEWSNQMGEEFTAKALRMTLEEVEQQQEKYGVSNVDIEKHLKISISVLSRWKNKKTELPEYYKISLYAFFKYLEDSADRK
jgi:hypothetical protein